MLDQRKEQSGRGGQRPFTLLFAVSRGQVEIWSISMCDTHPSKARRALGDRSRISRQIRKGHCVGMARAHPVSVRQNTF
jgi:hypothetical protein